MKKIIESNGLKGYVKIKQSTKTVKEYNVSYHEKRAVRKTFYSIEAYANGTFIASEKDIDSVDKLEALSIEYERRVKESLDKSQEPKKKGFFGFFSSRGYK